MLNEQINALLVQLAKQQAEINEKESLLKELEKDCQIFEKKMMCILAVTTVLTIIILILLPLKTVKDVIVMVLVIAVAFIANTLNLVALATKKETISCIMQ